MDITLKELEKKHQDTNEALTAAREAMVEMKSLGLENKEGASEAKEKAEKANAALDKLEEKNQELVKEMATERKNREETAKQIKAMEANISKLKTSGGSYTGGEKARKEELEREMKSLQIFSQSKLLDQDDLERKGVEKKYFRSDDNEAGGFIMTESYDEQIRKPLEDFSPMRAHARTKTINGLGENLYTEEESVQAYWLGEGINPFTESNFSFGAPRIPLHSMVVRTTATNKALMGTRFNFDNLVADGFRRARLKLEGYAWLNGNGIDKPTGILAAESGLTTDTDRVLESATAGDIAWNDTIKLTGKVQTGYAQNAILGMNRQTLTYLRTLTDPNGSYIFVAGQKGAKIPNMINGDPYVEFPNMPAIAEGAFPIMYGDFYEGYEIVDATQAIFLRNPWKTDGKVQFTLEAYTGGQVIEKKALALLKVKSS